MEKIKMTALACVPLLLGIGFISTGLYNRAEFEPASFWGSMFFGVLMLFAAVVIFFALVLPTYKDKAFSVTKDIKNAMLRDTTGQEDKSPADTLVTEFKKTYNEFFSAHGIPENSTLQNTATQVFWHILSLQKRRMENRGVSMSFESERKTYGGNSIDRSTIFDKKYTITEVRERISALRTYVSKSGKAYKKKNTELAHYTIAKARTTSSEDRVICPNCGNETTRENLLDGCDFCGTKFTVEDLGSRVNSFALRDDYETTVEKYRDIRAVIKPRAITAMVLPFFIFSVIGMFSVWNELEAGIGMRFVACVFGVACITGLAYAIARYTYSFVVFPILSVFDIAFGYYTENAVKKRYEIEKTNDSVFEKMKRFDPLFSADVFMSNVQNKLAAIHYAENKTEIQAFAECDLSSFLKNYSDIVDMEVVEYKMKEYSTDETTQTVKMFFLLNLLSVHNNGFKNSAERLDLTLVRSADSKTEAVCAPSVFKCKSCGNSITLLNGGVCEYCGNTLNLRGHDWVISEYSIR